MRHASSTMSALMKRDGPSALDMTAKTEAYDVVLRQQTAKLRNDFVGNLPPRAA
jgi:hypothetical protein